MPGLTVGYGRRTCSLRVVLQAGAMPMLLGAQAAGAVEFDTVISVGGVLGAIPAVRRIKMDS